MAVRSFQERGEMLEVRRLGFFTLSMRKAWEVLESQFPSVGATSAEHQPVRVKM